jgi:hypothetical protein
MVIVVLLFVGYIGLVELLRKVVPTKTGATEYVRLNYSSLERYPVEVMSTRAPQLY